MHNQFGPYRLDRLIGKGGMGEVYVAINTRDRNQTKIALKLLSPQVLSDPRLVRRFRQECLLAKRLRHPHVLPMYDWSEIDGTAYVAMYYVEGTNLASMIKEGPLPPGQAVAIVGQVATALDAAHRKKLRHRDVKPSNILLEKTGAHTGGGYHAWLVDWGIAQPIDISGAHPVTRTKQVVGTPGYIAPDRLKDDITPDHRADVYALAVVLYECLSGRRPFVGNDVLVLTAQMTHEAPPLPPHLPDGLRAVVARGLAKDPDRRYQSAGEFAAAARAALSESHDKPTLPVTTPPVATPDTREHGETTATRPGRGLKTSVAALLAGIAGVLAALALYLTGRVDGPTLAWAGPALAVAGVFLTLGASGWRRDHTQPD